MMNMSRDFELIGDVSPFLRRGEACVLTIKRTCLDPKDAPDGLGRFGHGRLAPTEHRLLKVGG